MLNRKNPYLFYTEYYLISGAYHIANVVHDVLTYSTSFSDNIKGYLHNKVINKKIMLDEIDINNGVVKNNDADVDEDGFVVIKMRRPKIKNDSVTALVPVVPVVPVTYTLTNSKREMDLDNNVVQSIINNILNNILDNLETHTI